MLVIYTLYAVAKKLNISRTKLQKVIDDLISCGIDGVIREVEKDENKKGRFSSSFYITEKGLKEIELWINEPDIVLPSEKPLNAPQSDFYDKTVIETLQEQLKAKDGQIQALQEQINTLLLQCSNYQQLLQNQQYLSLPQKKQNIFKWLFSRNADE